jgi:hypothetical protein
VVVVLVCPERRVRPVHLVQLVRRVCLVLQDSRDYLVQAAQQVLREVVVVVQDHREHLELLGRAVQVAQQVLVLRVPLGKVVHRVRQERTAHQVLLEHLVLVEPTPVRLVHQVRQVHRVLQGRVVVNLERAAHQVSLVLIRVLLVQVVRVDFLELQVQRERTAHRVQAVQQEYQVPLVHQVQQEPERLELPEQQDILELQVRAELQVHLERAERLEHLVL